MSTVLQLHRPPSKRPEGDSNSVWSKLVHRAEACPQCGNRICLVSERILHPTRKFSCSYCGCISHTPFYAYLMPTAFTAISVSKFYDSPIYYKMGSRFRDVGLLCICLTVCRTTVPFLSCGGASHLSARYSGGCLRRWCASA